MFTAQGISLITDPFRIDQLYRAVRSGIGAAFAAVVCGDPPFQVVCDPRVKRSVPAADDIAAVGPQFLFFFRKNPPKNVCWMMSDAVESIAAEGIFSDRFGRR